jgi:hypothetical protein
VFWARSVAAHRFGGIEMLVAWVGLALVRGADGDVLIGTIGELATELAGLVTGAAASGFDEAEQPASRHNAVPNTADRTIKGGPAERVVRIVERLYAFLSHLS